MRLGRWTPYLLILPSIGILVFLTIYPMTFSLWVSLHTWYLGRPKFFPFVGLHNYYTLIFRDPVFGISLRNTGLILLVCLPIEFFLGLFLALLLNRRDIKGTTIFRLCLITPMVMIPIVTGVLWKFILHPSYGVFNYLIGLLGFPGQAWTATPGLALFSVIVVEIWQWTPFVVIVLYSGLLSLPLEPFEAAQLDGASSRQILRYLTLPLLGPVILVALTLRMIDMVKLFDVVYVLTRGGPAHSSEVLTLYNFRVGLNYFKMGRAAAMSWITAAIVIVLIQVYLRVVKSEFI